MPNNFRRFLLAAVDDGVLALTLNCVCVCVCVCASVCLARIMIYTELSRRWQNAFESSQTSDKMGTHGLRLNLNHDKEKERKNDKESYL